MKRQDSLALAVIFLCISFAGSGLIAADRSRSFAVSRGGMLEVNISGGNITLNPWEKNEVFVAASGIDDENAARFEMTQTGNTVRVEYRPRHGSDRLHLDISLPSQFNTDLRTAGGNIEVRGAISGNLLGSTAGGDIRLNDVNGRTDMKTSGGNVTAGNIRGDATLKTSGGDINLGNADGVVDVHTSGGNIRISNVGRTVTAKTSGGNIVVGNVGGEANVATSGGNIDAGKIAGSAQLNTAGGNIELNGATGMVTARTAGGNLRLHDISGSIQAATAGGDVEAELIPSGKGNSRLITAGGDVRISLPENSRASIEAVIRIQNWRRNGNRYEIRSDFPHQNYRKDEQSEEIRSNYVLNGGGERITLETVNGNIEIRKLGRR
ncbi:MAG TPA: DUF4097 family beta strand repeat-containing protein [Acidobacteriota bacterium]|jgi:DUF4097 and DUF4098 domain-containing protein YvlB